MSVYEVGREPKAEIALVIRSCCLVSAVAVVAATVPWSPLQAATAIATADANIVSTISVATRNGLGFGDISSSAVAGTVIMTPSGSRSTTGGTTINSAIAGSAAAFDIAGDANASYSITLPASVVLSDASSNIMVVDNYTSSPTLGGVLDGSGQQTLYVGATLNVGSNQPFGAYTGLISVTVEYN
ncbi:MAG: DUF4402 domain-containing protein [Pseudomonadota bacterium]